MNTISLMYHDVYLATPTESGLQNAGSHKYKIDIHSFERQVKAIVEYCQHNKLSLAQVQFTFDDGGSSFFRLIAPLLESYGLKGYFFISTHYLNTKGFLTDAEVAQLHKKGHIIGSHSHTHPYNLSKCNERVIQQEWKISIAYLERIIGEKVIYASLPGGSYSEEMLDSLAGYGIQFLFTSEPIQKQQNIGTLTLIGRYPITKQMRDTQVVNLLSEISYERGIKQIEWRFLSALKSLFGNNYIKIRAFLLSRRRMY